MKRTIIYIAMAAIAQLSINAEENIETYNIVSDNYVDTIQDVELIRPLNGGTVITPIFDESCPKEMEEPFRYACRIVEEYMPPCLPLNVKISCAPLRGANRNAISKIGFYHRENFGNNINCKNSPMSMIKGVILAEQSHGSTISYLDSVPSIDFLNYKPDIEIIYNEQKLNDLYMSLESAPGEKYDFITVAIRDIFIGLGISHSYRYNYMTNGLENPNQEMIPFESFINKTLGNYGDPVARLEKATKGELVLYDFKTPKLKLYAPNTWVNGVSLNYFIPQSDCSISNILSHDLCKGMVMRSLNDKYADWIFRTLLGWEPSYTVSTGGSSTASSGSTSLLMPYNGTITFGGTENASYPKSTFIVSPKKISRSEYENSIAEVQTKRMELLDYVYSFHPFKAESGFNGTDGVSVSILKKDGTWDLVKFIGVYEPTMEIPLSDLEFHFDEKEYARTADGHLRARITTKFTYNNHSVRYNATYFAVGYLPQKVNLSYTLPESTESNAEISPMAIAKRPIRLYFSNLEGINRVVLERLREGNRLPSKIDVKDFKKGYFDTTVDRTTTFTAVGYNENGHSRGIPVTITNEATAMSYEPMGFKLSDSQIKVDAENEAIINTTYNISALNAIGNKTEQSGHMSESIDISNLPKGIHVLTVYDSSSNIIGTFKFKN